MSSVTPFQPVLPVEGDFTDAEIAFLEESPPGLFPDNQNSNFGLILRKTFTDHAQELIGDQQTLYNERFVETSQDYLDVWEADYGLPRAPQGRSVAQRRQDVLSRIQVGPYTRARRAKVVENFITPTFGAGVLLTPAGVPILSGVPLYSGASGLEGLYTIRENFTWRNLLANSNFETDTSGWASPNFTLTRITSAPTPKFGTNALRATYAGGGDPNAGYFATTPGIGVNYVFSAYVYIPAAWDAGAISCNLSATGGTQPTLVSSSQANMSLRDQWQRIYSVWYINSASSHYNVIQAATLPTVGRSIVYDGVQAEIASALNDYSDQAGLNYWYEVRIHDSVSPDLVGLTRELTRITPAGISFEIVSTPSP